MIEHLTKEKFLDRIFNYEKNKDWKYEGSKPCLIDFYADWCGPCKMVSPVIEELAKDYEGKLDVFKIDTEAELELSAAFGIRSIPSFLFIPVDGLPRIALGALPKESFIQALKDVLGIEK